MTPLQGFKIKNPVRQGTGPARPEGGFFYQVKQLTKHLIKDGYRWYLEIIFGKLQS
jgi:hypothetical protein